VAAFGPCQFPLRDGGPKDLTANDLKILGGNLRRLESGHWSERDFEKMYRYGITAAPDLEDGEAVWARWPRELRGRIPQEYDDLACTAAVRAPEAWDRLAVILMAPQAVSEALEIWGFAARDGIKLSTAEAAEEWVEGIIRLLHAVQ
jgi:predicted nucleic acid-binding protein